MRAKELLFLRSGDSGFMTGQIGFIVKAMEEYAEQESKEFAEWKEMGMWAQYNLYGENKYKGLWYNTINIKSMPKPLTTTELYKKFRNECRQY